MSQAGGWSLDLPHDQPDALMECSEFEPLRGVRRGRIETELAVLQLGAKALLPSGRRRDIAAY